MAKDKILPPHSIDAEEAVLGSILTASEFMGEISLILMPNDFYSERNRSVYEACLSLQSRKDAINQVTIGHELENNPLNEIERSYLGHLISGCPTALDALDYAKIVSRLGLMRRLLAASAAITELAHRADPDVADTLSKASKLIGDLHGATKNQGIVPPYIASDELFDYLMSEQNESHSLSYGFSSLDAITGGVFPGEYVIIGARPGMGKTELLQQLTTKFSRAGKTGLWISLEMLRQPGLMERWIATETGVDIKRLRNRDLVADEWAAVTRYAAEIAGNNVYFLDGDLSVDRIAMYITQLAADIKLDYVMLDYIQLIKDCVMGDNANAALTRVSRVLKTTAKQLQIPIICASQLNRKLEERQNKRPIMADLRDSGSLEQDADVIWFLYRDEIYNPNDTDSPGITEIKMSKNRQLGPAPVKHLRWDYKTRRLYDVIYSEVN